VHRASLNQRLTRSHGKRERDHEPAGNRNGLDEVMDVRKLLDQLIAAEDEDRRQTLLETHRQLLVTAFFQEPKGQTLGIMIK
jgi:hypothetical protein